MNTSVRQAPLRRDAVAALVIDAIQEMNLQPGDRLISEKLFAARLGVNHLTLRSAYAELAEKGILERRPSSGTYIKSTTAIDVNSKLLTSRKNAVTLLLRNDQHFFAEIAGEVSRELHNRAYLPMLLSYVGTFAPEDMARLDGIREIGVGNLVFDNTILTDNIDMPASQLIRGFDRAVGLLGCWFREGIDAVSGDYGAAYSEAVSYLRRKGHRKIMFCGGITDPGHPRARGNSVLAGHFAKAMIECGLGDYMRIKSFGADAGYSCVAEVLSAADRPTAIFCEMDYRAAKIIDLAREKGLRVPEDLSVIGFYDTPWAAHYDLSSFRFDNCAIAKMAVDFITDPPAQTEVKLTPIEFVERGSVRDLPQ